MKTFIKSFFIFLFVYGVTLFFVACSSHFYAEKIEYDRNISSEVLQ